MFGRTRQDRLFARFVERGDVQALGEVFDATAPELMRIAAHLVGSREQAADRRAGQPQHREVRGEQQHDQQHGGDERRAGGRGDARLLW